MPQAQAEEEAEARLARVREALWGGGGDSDGGGGGAPPEAVRECLVRAAALFAPQARPCTHTIHTRAHT